MVVRGNIEGLSQGTMKRMDALYHLSVERQQVISDDLALEMACITHATNKEIAVYIDRRGKVVHVAVGNDYTVPLEEISVKRGHQSLNGVRCIHTHPGEDGALSPVDLAALDMMRFDCMVAIGVMANGSISSVGIGFKDLGPGGHITTDHRIFSGLEEILKFDFLTVVEEIERTADKMHQVKKKTSKEKVLLIGLQTDKDSQETLKSLDELEQLAYSAGLIVVAKDIQRRSQPDSSTYIGRGKALEIQLAAQANRIDVIVFDNELSPAQLRNLEGLIGAKIIDRTMLILDIFAQRAWSNEGKLQVELAQLKYLLPRLSGQGTTLSRLGGGIGTRGPGETKLEVDRRRIRKRISNLEQRIETIRKSRSIRRKNWKKIDFPVVALVGYTNAGKSTLMNRLTSAGVTTEDKLFATLDPTTRIVELPDRGSFLLTDTVGFIKKLPHHLIAAFRATLEEIGEADLLLHVIDGSNDLAGEYACAVNKVLKDLEVMAKPVICVVNKIDLNGNDAMLARLMQKFDHSVAISAKSGIGMENLLKKIREMLPQATNHIRVVIPFNKASLVRDIYNRGKVISEEYIGEGIKIEAYVDQRLKSIVEKHVCDDKKA